ncbi:hypothetical protein JMF89_07115 [Clostridiaceae bacterium UIB06]|uniref:Uncharacterized protein n=1 Tax=Clostridium thailandense TaxID=2794346 RepID=A0A949TL29_9CLOT|nr:hypothetical protein [Clostridium thailandense]MBV7272447.1 hypothetical protein [Clostridium thailandense]MCH5136971.1 hypothetical protein [Clostridiaceae bacterium UIB06]
MSIENKKLTENAKEMKLSDEQLEHIAAGKKHKHPYDGHPHIEEYGYVFYCTAPGIAIWNFFQSDMKS